MGHVVRLIDGHLVYDGLLTSKEKATIDEILHALQEEIPLVEADLKEEYGDSVWYKYNLGIVLGGLLETYHITVSERRIFWREIKELATEETRKRDEGVDSELRCFYHQCYVLSQIDKEIVKKLSWRQWQSLLDRDIYLQEPRIFAWVGTTVSKIKENEWREFVKGLNYYMTKKDTSVFNDEELFDVFDKIFEIGVFWLSERDKFIKENPKSTKLNDVKKKVNRSRKYIALCHQLKKELKQPFSKEIYARAFELAMK